ncbi:hypothetical protein [Arthrobacter sp. H35-D1]|uniref:hypothetical protein n=1 Tax=Arthrobacter sp. H35-D1 TaxID=3046202 RepID=UPI0024B98CD9|nr:hypothetical protein [Arthrobacter sp. H35-D1]MDJ0312831.1 hypothetical protein [Arthrobacter sp. H35-D1]
MNPQRTPAGAPYWIDLTTSDLKKSHEFYAALFGWSTHLGVDNIVKPIEAAKNAGSIVYLQPLDVPEQGKIAMLVTPARLRRGCGDLAPMLGSRPMKKTVRLRGMSCTPKSRDTNPGDGERELAGIMGAAAFLPHGTPSSWHVYFQTHGVDATIAKSLTLGAAIVNAADDSPSVRKVWYIFQAPGSTKPVS